ncbi:MAG: NUDIX domain-containing protein [Candidatus Roizmanbacteria bacterium]|nr:NUDIX domain-containing protein [Candidatus Roizmanbacteria bacterium]
MRWWKGIHWQKNQHKILHTVRRLLIHRAINIALFNSKGQLVLQKRSTQKDLYPGYYALSSTGHVSKGETYEEAAVRELKEEMGVSNIELKRIETFLVPAKDEVEMITLFTGTYDGDYSYPSDEVESIQYFFPQEIQKLESITACSKKSLQIMKIML